MAFKKICAKWHLKNLFRMSFLKQVFVPIGKKGNLNLGAVKA
jgi:hypothetical protein